MQLADVEELLRKVKPFAAVQAAEKHKTAYWFPSSPFAAVQAAEKR